MTPKASRHSAQVELYLILDGRQWELGQVGPTECFVRRPEDHPPGQAEILVVVDGQETRLPVYLPDGISTQNRRVVYTRLPDSSTSSLSQLPVTELAPSHQH